MCRPAAKQTWPWNWNAENAPAAVAASRSASSSTMNALLPPSSSDDLLQPRSGQLADAPARRSRSGERHHRHVRVGDERLADIGAADDDLEQAVGQPGLAEDRLEHGAADDRRLRIGLEDDGVAEGERRGDDAHPEHARRVPRRDRADHADRDPADHRQPPRHHGRDQRAVRLPRQRRGGEHLAIGEVRLVVHLALARRPSRASSMSRTRRGSPRRCRRPCAGCAPAPGTRSRPRQAALPWRAAAARATSSVVEPRDRRDQPAGCGLTVLDRLTGPGLPTLDERGEPAGRRRLGGVGGDSGHQCPPSGVAPSVEKRAAYVRGASLTTARCPVDGSRHTGPRVSTASISPSSR